MGSERKQTLRRVNGEKRRGLVNAKGGKDLEDSRGERREIMEEYHHA